MKRIRLGVWIADREFMERFTGCMARHYRQFELHIYSGMERVRASAANLDAVLLEGVKIEDMGARLPVPVVCLRDSAQEIQPAAEGGGVYLTEKYQDVNGIVDEIMRHIGEEIRNVTETGDLPARARTLAVYSLSENEYQLPLAVTLASIIGEQERVLLLDLQENSGLSQLIGDPFEAGLEELLVMMEGGKFSQNRMTACIGHLDRLDYVYPAGNTECLCESCASTYRQIISVLAREMGYHTVILNLGSRFTGFFKVLAECQEVYLLKSRVGPGRWRQKEFTEEMDKHGVPQLREHIREIAVPMITGSAISCERLIEQWKWNDIGDSIRRMMPEAADCG